jgi:DNA-binding transcriptional LysR family regulator
MQGKLAFKKGEIMEIQSLIYFSQVAKTLNYSQAASSSYISRQALKQQVLSLERELGVTLFSNHKNHLSLTTQGEYLYQACQPLIWEYENLQQKIREMPKEKKLRLGICSALVPMQYIISQSAIKKFEEDNACQIQREMLTVDECMEGLDRGELDAAYVFVLDDPLFVYDKYPVYESPVYIEHGAGIHFNRKSVTAKDLSSYPFLLMGKPEHMIAPLWRDMQEQGESLSYEINVNTIETFYHMMQGECAIFDLVGNEQEVGFPGVEAVLLEGYRFFVGLLVRPEVQDRALIIKLQQFLQEGYPFRLGGEGALQ